MSAITYDHLPPGHEPGHQTVHDYTSPRSGALSTVLFIPVLFGVGVWAVIRGLGPHAGGAGVTAVALATAGFLFGLGGLFLWSVWPRAGMAGTLETAPGEVHRGETVKVRLTPPPEQSLPMSELELGLVARERYTHSEGVSGSVEREEWTKPIALSDGSYEATFRVPADGPFSYEGGRLTYYWLVTARGAPGRLRKRPFKALPLWVKP